MTFLPGQSGNPVGRKAIKLDRVQLDQITKSYALGSPEILIAHQLGMQERTWLRLKNRDPRIAEALALGKAKQEAFYHGNLLKMAHSNVVANIFPLKAKHGWRENDPPPAETSRITIVLPATLTDADYQKALAPALVGEVVKVDDE